MKLVKEHSFHTLIITLALSLSIYSVGCDDDDKKPEAAGEMAGETAGE